VALGAGGQAANAAGRIEKACLEAGRSSASRQLCGCIQDVADRMFTRTEQKRLVEFFEDPHLTQVLRQSDKASDERFWEKYQAFGAAAESYCGS
jgi:hypothetical protein